MRTAVIGALRLRGVADGLLDPLFGGDAVRLVDVYEEWDPDGATDTVRVGGAVSVAADAGFEVAGLGLSLGPDPDGRLEVPFAVDLPAAPVGLLLAALSVRAGFIGADDVTDLDVPAAARALGLDIDAGTTFRDLDLAALGDLGAFLRGDDPVRVTVGPVPGWLVLPATWLRHGVRTTDEDGRTVVVAVDDAPPVMVPLGTVTLSVGTDGIAVDLDPADRIDLPPLLLHGTGVAVEARGVTWRDDAAGGGLALEEVTVWGLGTLLPFLPPGDAAEQATIHLTDWVLARDGLTGRATLTYGPGTPGSDGPVRPRAVTLGFDRSWWPVELAATVDLDVGGLLGGPEHLLTVDAGLRLDPHAAPADRWAVDLVVRGVADGPVAELAGPALTGLAAACTALSLLAAGPGAVPDAAVLLGALAALDGAGLARWDTLALDGISAHVDGRDVPLPDGRTVRARVLAVRADLRLDVTLRPPTTDVPLGLGVAGVDARYVLDDIDGLDTRLSIDWDVGDGLAVTLPAPVDLAGPVTVTSATLRRADAGLVLELGADTGGSGEVALAGLPDLVTVTYDPTTGAVSVDVGRRGQQVTLLVPGVLYAEGTLRHDPAGADPLGSGDDWGQVLRGDLRAFLIADGPVDSPEALRRKDSYLFDLDVGLLSATRATDGLQAFVLTLDAGFRPGLPIGASGVSLYGLGLTFAQNGAPAVADGDYAHWFLDQPPQYTTGAAKWTPAAGHWGFGAAATLGSGHDDGATWNVAAGLFLLVPGPVLVVTGRGNLFAPMPELPATGGDPDGTDAAFAAVIVLDLLRDRFSLDLRGELTRSAAGRELLSVNVPAEIRADLTNPPDVRVSLGRPTPEEDRVRVRALDLWDLSAYLVVSGLPLDLPQRGRPDLTLPGVAVALGGAGGLEQSFRAGPVALALWARAGFDVGLSLRLPLLAGQVWLTGGVDVSAFGFGLSMRADLTLGALAPSPFHLWGDLRVVMELPWFLPDLDVTASLRIGRQATWLDDAPPAPDPVGSLTLWGRGTAAPQVITPGGHAADVPLDVVPEIVFTRPVGNEDDDLGSLAVVGTDTADPVWDVATTAEADGDTEQLGHRHVLTGATLRVVDGPVLQGVAATWPQGTENGNTDRDDVPRVGGGQAARTTLRLFDPLAATTDARIGLGATLTRRRWTGWDPCDLPAGDPKSLNRQYTFRSLAHLLERGGWRPPHLDVEVTPIDHVLDLADVVRRPDLWRLPDLDVVRPVPDLRPIPDIRPVPDVGPLPDIRPVPNVRPLPDVGPLTGPLRLPDLPIRRPDLLIHPTSPLISRAPDRPAPTPPTTPAEPVSRLRAARASVSDRVRARLDSAVRDTTAGEDTTSPAAEDAAPTYATLVPLLVHRSGLATDVLRRVDPSGRTPLHPPRALVLAGTLPLMWASAVGAVPLGAGERWDLPNETPPDDLPARVVVEDAPTTAGFWRRTFGVTAEPARLAPNPMSVAHPSLLIGPDDPVLGLPRLVLPQNAVGAPGPAPDPGSGGDDSARMIAESAGRVRVDLGHCVRASAALLLAPGVHALAWATDPDGTERRLDLSWDEPVALDGPQDGSEVWRLVRFHATDLTAMRFAAYHGVLDPEPAPGRLPVAAALVSLTSTPPYRDRHGPAVRSRDRYAEVVSGLLEQPDQWAQGHATGVLEPGTTYELTVEGRSWPARASDRHPRHVEVGGAGTPWTRTFTFTTTDRPPAALTPFPGDAAPAAGDDATEAAPLAEPGTLDDAWQVATSPADGAPSHYRGDPLVVRLRDARTLAVLAAFDREPRVWLTDDHGRDVAVTARLSLRAAADVPAAEQPVRDRLADLPCLLPGDTDPARRWSEAVLHLDTVLEPGRRYTAELLAARRGGAGDAEPLHRWRFRASRWTGPAEHLHAHGDPTDGVGQVVAVDEIVPDGPAVRAALATRLAGTTPGAPVVDDETLDAWLVDTLRLPPTTAPSRPEAVVVWAWHPDDDTATPVAVLLDGPEPLLRGPDARVHVAAGNGPVDAVVVTGRTRARVLVVPAAGHLPTGPVTLTVGAGSRTHDLTLTVPARPAALEPGDAR